MEAAPSMVRERSWALLPVPRVADQVLGFPGGGATAQPGVEPLQVGVVVDGHALEVVWPVAIPTEDALANVVHRCIAWTAARGRGQEGSLAGAFACSWVRITCPFAAGCNTWLEIAPGKPLAREPLAVDYRGKG